MHSISTNRQDTTIPYSLPLRSPAPLREDILKSSLLQRFRASAPLRLCVRIFFLFCLASALPALDFSFRPSGSAFFPGGPGNTTEIGEKRYGIGGGGELGFEMDMASVLPNPLGLGYSLGAEAAVQYNVLQSPALGTVQFYSAGGTAGLSYFPLSRLFTRIDGAVGAYRSLIKNEAVNKPGLWWRAGGSIGFRFTPAIIFSANLGWRQFQSNNSTGNIFSSGVYTGLGLQFNFEAGPGAGTDGINVLFEQDDGVYPVIMSLYRQFPIGNISVCNNENAEIRNVQLSFRTDNYTMSEYPCGSFPFIAKGKNGKLDLYADFSNEILRFTDTGRISGELIVKYNFLGKEKQSVHAVSVQVFSHNAYPSGDPAILAAFISPNSADVLEFSKNITGMARNNSRPGLNSNMQFAVWLLEGIRCAGIQKTDEYLTVGETQFPSETLAFRTGSVTDIGILYAGMLAASGIPVSFIPLPNDFIIAYDLNTSESMIKLLFNDQSKVLFLNGKAYMPLSMNAINEGFMQSWDKAVSLLKKYSSENETVDFIALEDAWYTYPPVSLPNKTAGLPRLSERELGQKTTPVFQQYIDIELAPKLRQIQAQLASNPTAATYNQQGITLARMGRTAEAKAAYERAANMGSIPAMNNRGSLALIEKDYAVAERWFKMALSRDKENQAALRGLEKVSIYQERQ